MPQELDGALPGRLFRQVLVQREHLGDLSPHAHHRVETCERILEHHGEFLPSQAVPLPLGEAEEFATVEAYRTAVDLRRRREHPHGREASHRLPAPGLAYDPDRLPGFDRKADPAQYPRCPETDL